MIEEQKEFNSVKLSLVLLNSICKLFFQRAPEVHKIMASFMEQLIKNSTDADLRQRAVFYYRLLKNDINSARQIISGEGDAIELFFEDQNDDMKERLFLEFNTLSVVY
jgi:AP-4 complex subunit beta-1